MKDQPTEEGQTLEGHKLLWGIWVVSLPLAAILVLFSKDVFTETFGEPFKIWLGMGTGYASRPGSPSCALPPIPEVWS